MAEQNGQTKNLRSFSSHNSAARWNYAYISLGSNIAPEANLPAAYVALTRYGAIQAVSQVWESAPVGFDDQPNFLNAAVLLETELSAVELRRTAIAAIERELKRQRDPANPNGPRTIDLDISLFNSEIIDGDGLQIPDAEIVTRPFVAVPLAELDPEYVHPVNGRTLRAIAEEARKLGPTMRLRADVCLAGP